MARPKSLKPNYRFDKSSGRAFVELDGRRVYLGAHGTQASRDRYDSVVGEWIANGRRLPARVAAEAETTVAIVVAAFWRHAQAYYREPDGTPAGELSNFKDALRPLLRLYATTAATEFGPLALKALMDEMVRLKWSRTHVNRQAARVRHVFKWAVAQELIPASIHHALQAVTGLRRGRTEARESEPVKPVPDAHVAAIKDYVGRQVWAMVELQLLTGMRPGEVVIMRGRDVDTTAKLWTYKPHYHKTEHHGIDRSVYLGPKAQAVLAPFFRPNVSEYLFSPKDAEAERYAARKTHRRAPLEPPTTSRRVRDRYDVNSYRTAIQRACDKAFPPPPALARGEKESDVRWILRLTPAERVALARWREQHRWAPGQLRHNAATAIRRGYGLDAAQVILGHTTAATTEIYAERDGKLAERIMSEIG